MCPKRKNFKNIYPLLPVRDVIVLPNMLVPLAVGRKKSLNAIRASVDGDSKIIVASQRDLREENPTSKDIYEYAVLGNIVQILNLPDGSSRILLEGEKRVRIKEFFSSEDLYEAKIDILKSSNIDMEKSRLKALMRKLGELFEEYGELNPKLEMPAYAFIDEIEDPDRLTDVIASQVRLKKQQAYRLLKQLDPLKRIKSLMTILKNEVEILSIQRELDGKVQGQIEQSQKEYYLSEQMKVIKKELEGKDVQIDEFIEFQNKLDEAGLPSNVKEHAEKELSRLKKMMPFSPEGTVVRTYLEWILKLPWAKKTTSDINLNKARNILEKEHYALNEAKERILEYLAVSKLSKRLKTPIVCFLGPPGTGKTSFAKSIAHALGRKFIRVSLGGVKDESEIRGHRKTYIGSMPGRVIQSIAKAGSSNPVFLLDEIDKMGNDFRGDPASALLEALDPEQNTHFSDHYLEVEYDLSDIMFITTANSYDGIPPALLDRMEIIEFSGYTMEEKINIVKKFILPKQLKENGLNKNIVSVNLTSIASIIENYTREAGVRNIEREISKLLRKIAVEVAENKIETQKITADLILKYLGVAKYSNVRPSLNDVGVASGLAYTQNGGESLSIEVSMMPGKGNLEMTGTLGDVMKESAQTALSFIRANTGTLDIPENFYEDRDIHIHVPAGSIPKEGPSAGITICTALMSVIKNRPVKKNVVMTGEITLSGRVLEIGGLKEKMLAAHRDGFKTVIFPADNKKNLMEIPEKVKNKLKLVAVDSYKEVMEHVF